MKTCWLKLSTWQKDLVTAALEAGVDAILTEPEYVKKIRELGIVTIIANSKDADIKIPENLNFIQINNKKDEQFAASELANKSVVVATTDWDIIPIENLIPINSERLYTLVHSSKEAKLAVEIMEKGVAGVVLETDDPLEIGKTVNIIKSFDNKALQLEELEIVEVKQLGIGDRVCVDTCSLLKKGEGLLVGDTSHGFFLVHAENVENPYVDPRPFRVNAGAVHAYVKIPGNKTEYLGQLKTGGQLTVVDYKGNQYTAYVGRVKIEKRPLLGIFAKDKAGNKQSIILQNAETIRLTTKDGKPISVVALKPGDHVLGLTELGGRHFGMAVEESIQEN